MNGVEEVPFPKGAIQFKLDGIAQSLVVFFIFTVPLIIYQQQTKDSSPITPSARIEKPRIEKTSENNELENNDNGEWEEATIEDLESGRFESI